MLCHLAHFPLQHAAVSNAGLGLQHSLCAPTVPFPLCSSCCLEALILDHVAHCEATVFVLQLKEQLDDQEVAQRLAHVQSFAKSGKPTSDLEFPPPPSVVPQYMGTGLGSWMPAEPEVISVTG